MRWNWAVVVMGLTLVAALLAGCGSAAGPASAPPAGPVSAPPVAPTGTTSAGGEGGVLGAPGNAVVTGLGATAALRVGQSLWVAEVGVQVEALDVLDSRCPQGVTCARAGEVKAQLRVSEGGRELGTVTLASAPKDAQSKSVGGYTVTLVDVQPPKTLQETPKGEYVLTVRISRG